MRASVAAVCICFVALTACERESRPARPAPARTAIYSNAAPESELQPGGVKTAPMSNPYHGSAYEISEGQRLFEWYNCSGCHSHGGGGIGPPLVKKHWIYGGQPANLFDTIIKGRPNGMPAWGGKIPEYQVWQLVAYIRSLNGQEPQSATSRRIDELEGNPGGLQNKVPGVTK